MSKCDFCDKPMTNYGFQHCYFACDDHVKEGVEVERQLFEEMEKAELENFTE